VCINSSLQSGYPAAQVLYPWGRNPRYPFLERCKHRNPTGTRGRLDHGLITETAVALSVATVRFHELRREWPHACACC